MRAISACLLALILMPLVARGEEDSVNIGEA